MSDRYLGDNNYTIEEQKHIYQLAEELSKQLIDKTMMKNYGTSVKEGMNQNYIRMIEEKYYELKDEFNKIDTNKDHKLSFDELYDFFARNPKNQGNIDQKYIERLFVLLDRNKNQVISIEEFIFAYIGFEEKLRLKKSSLDLLAKDLRESKVKFEEKKENLKDETLNKEGVCKNASLSITLFEAKDLQGNPSITNDRSTFVCFSLDGKKQRSHIVTNDPPVWNEDFTFPITRKNEELLIEVFDKGTLTGSTLIGSVKLDLYMFEDQLKKENWYQLSLGTTPEGFGSIHLKFKYIYDWKKYYNDLSIKTDAQIKRLNEDLKELERYQQLFKQPFGIIVAGEIDAIIEKRMFEKSEDILDYIASTRKSIYIMPKQDNSTITRNPIQSLFSGPESVEWPLITKILVISSLGLCLLSFLGKADFLNLLVVIGALILVMTDSKSNADMKSKLAIYSLIGVCVYDLIWLLFMYGFWHVELYHDSSIRLASYIMIALNCGVKGGLAFFINQQNYKINVLKQKATNEIQENDLQGH